MKNKHLAWFLGPKAENAETFLNTINDIVQDYIHWRRNYYPGDKILIGRKIQRQHEEESDKLRQGVTEMMSQLRRNFPFYSPRYIAHMLSDISMPSMFGYLAGMLHNSNNVTPEAAPVTVEWEIEACNEILKMLGFKPSPSPPAKDAPIKEWEIYHKKLKDEFGWAHITSGGTVANIEALWVARIVKYFPLAIQDVAKQKKIPLTIKKPSGKIQDIKRATKKSVISLKPNESIYLFSRFIESLAKHKNVDISTATKLGAELLSNSKYSLTNNIGNIFKEFPPVIFCSGAAHYSISKAADILGIGKNSVQLVKTDSNFRMDVNDLRLKINKSTREGMIPLAVIAVGSTTEEGAVDPIHEVLDLREQFERNKDLSFWLHIDSAWGGYISSIFQLSQNDEIEIIVGKILSRLNVKNNLFPEHFDTKLDFLLSETKKIASKSDENHSTSVDYSHFESRLGSLQLLISRNEYFDFIKNYKKVIFDFGDLGTITGKRFRDIIKKSDFEIDLNDRSDSTADFVSDKISFDLNKYHKIKEIKWGGKPLISSFLAFKNADSITVDPHKLGYIQYPCGIVAFKNDRVRHFIMQRAPYITSAGHNALIHTPPRHLADLDLEKLQYKVPPYEDYKIAIDAFAPFMLEGSKPGAAAAAMWLSNKIIPLNRNNHGLIIRSSILATRELYEWLSGWRKMYSESGIKGDLLYDFVTFGIPDTNVLVFAIKNNTNKSIEGLNKLTEAVYENFTIQAELGSRDHSYSQSFFLSKTRMDNEHYPYDSFAGFFEACECKGCKDEYIRSGLTILRATVMNPYITPIRQLTEQNLIKEFTWELHRASNQSVKELI